VNLLQMILLAAGFHRRFSVSGETKMEMHGGSGLVQRRRFLLAAAFSLVLAAHLGAQGGNNAQIPATPRAAAPKNLTGYWVSMVTEDWRVRMVVPDKSDYQSVPLNPNGDKVADTWDPVKDQAAGEQCRSYGAPAIMRVPGRLHIDWQDDNTLRIDTDSGTQTRLLHFGGSVPQNVAPTWQGYSVASWEGNIRPDYSNSAPGYAAGGFVGLTSAGEAVRVFEPGRGYLKVVTNHLRPGYLRKNGVPYSADANLEEYFDVVPEPYTGNTMLMVTMVVTDPEYLLEPFVYSSHFKKIPDGSGWDPTTCHVDQPR
jgi:hypothetical protein